MSPTVLSLYCDLQKYFEAGPIKTPGIRTSGSLVIDVGANVGFFSLRFAKWVGDTGKVIAIEPEDRNYDSLIRRLRREGLFNRVDALKAVAAAAPGRMFLKSIHSTPRITSFSRDSSGLPVTAVTLDDLVHDKGPLRPALVKIDVQGAEMLVLKGAADILKIAGPALFIELHEEGLNKFGTSVSAILEPSLKGRLRRLLANAGGNARESEPSRNSSKGRRIGYVDVLFLKAT